MSIIKPPSEPQISVLMPVYNGARFIGAAIESVLNQTYREFEFIIVDDGSTDNTVEIIKQYAAKDARIILVENGRQGASKARNRGLKMARYPWIATVDADDIILPQKFEKQLQAAMADPEVVLWGTYFQQIDVNGNVISKVHQIGPITKEEFYSIDRTKEIIKMYSTSAMFKREPALAVGGYNENITASLDTELWDRLTQHGPAVLIPESLYQYRMHGSSISAKRFSAQRLVHLYVLARAKARLQNRELTLEEFSKDYYSKPIWVKIVRYIGQRGNWQFRNTAVLYSEKRYLEAVVSLLIAFVCNPLFVIRRGWNRIFPKREI